MMADAATQEGGCAIAVMAKAPRPGQVKTRLVPPLTPDMASALNASFLRDITENIRLTALDATIEAYVAYAPAGFEPLFDGMLAQGTRLILADGARVSDAPRAWLRTMPPRSRPVAVRPRARRRLPAQLRQPDLAVLAACASCAARWPRRAIAWCWVRPTTAAITSSA